MQPDDTADSAGERLAFPPPPALADMVRYFHVERGGSGSMVLPASPMALLTCFTRGGASVDVGNGALLEFTRPMLFGPRDRPTTIRWQPGSAFVCALLRPEFLPALLSIDAAALGNRPLALADLDRLPGLEAFEQRLRAATVPAGWAAALADWLLELRVHRPSRRDVFRLPQAHLNVPTAEIAARLGLSVRQLERRTLASYGQNIRARRRMERYVQLMLAMAQSPPRRGDLTRLAIDHGYHDQAHMIRDLVHFTGMSPRVLLRRITTDDALRLYRIRKPQEP